MTINFGLIGPGKIADRSLAPAIKKTKGACFQAVTSRCLARAKDFASKHEARGDTAAYNNYEEMLTDANIDAVLVATPDRLHKKHGIQAAKAGKHVLMEKPMVTNSREGEQLIEACKWKKLKLGVAYHLRWHEGHRKLIQQVHNEALGVLHHARIHWTFQAQDDSNWRADQKLGRWWSLASVGTHGLDLIRWAMIPSCGEIVDVKSTITNDFWNSPHDQTAMVNLKFESGATAELTTSVLFESESRFNIFGRKGKATAKGTLGPHGGGSVSLKQDELNFTQQDPYEGEIRDFVEAIQTGREPEVPGGEGLENVKVLEAAFPE